MISVFMKTSVFTLFSTWCFVWCFGKDVPVAPDRYVATIEANLVNENKTYIVKEWYDGSEMKGKRKYHYGDYIFTFLEDYSNDSDTLWLWLQNAEDADSDENVLYCSLEAYSNQTSRWFSNAGFFGKWLRSSSGSMYDATYEGMVGDTNDNGQECGDYNMRGLLADKWVKEESWNGTYYGVYYELNYNVSYYWSIGSNWAYATYNTSDESPIPLRVEVDGTHYQKNGTGYETTYDFYHSYEYVGFFTGDDAFDELEFDFYSEMPDWVDECDTTHYCQHYPNATVCSDSQGPDLPSLSNKFLVTGEINDKKNNVSYLMKEYYDYSGNRVHLELFYDNTYNADGIHQLDLDEFEQRWVWIGDSDNVNGYCQMDLVSSNSSGLDLFVEEVNGHVASAASWFHFNNSNKDNKIWMGYTTVRNAIPAEKWKGNWEEEYTWLNKYYVEIIADSYYYFNRDTWSMSISNYSDDIPLRFELNGRYVIYNLTDDSSNMVLWLNDTFDVSYDLIGFVNGDLDDSHFEVPDDWREHCTISQDYCNDERYKDLTVCYDGPELPTLPTQFEATIEAVFVSKNFSIITDEFYDFDNNRERVIFYPFTYYSTWSDYSMTVNYSSHFLENGDIFWSWTQGNGLGVDENHNTVSNCYLLEATQVDGSNDGLNFFFDSSKDHVVTTSAFFDWVTNNSVETYVGTKNVRGILSDRWKHKIENYETSFTASDGTQYEYETNMSVVYSFMAKEFQSNEIYGDYGIPVRADVTGTTRITSDSGDIYEYDYTHYYNFVKFIPRTPDDFWFEPPTNTSCNVTKYCNGQLSNGESMEVNGESSDEYEDLCDEMASDGTVFIESSFSSASSRDCDDDNSNDMAPYWAVAILLWIIFLVVGFVYGTYHERNKRKTMVQLHDDPNNPNL